MVMTSIVTRVQVKIVTCHTGVMVLPIVIVRTGTGVASITTAVIVTAVVAAIEDITVVCSRGC